MTRFSKLTKTFCAGILAAGILAGVRTTENAYADSLLPDRSSQDQQVLIANPLMRGVIKCVRNPRCREAIAEQVNRLARRFVEVITDLATDVAERLYDLITDIVQAQENREILAKLDHLEELLKENGV